MFVSMMRPIAGRVAAVMMVGGGLLVLPGCSVQEDSTPDPTAPAIGALADTPVVSLPPNIAQEFPEGPAYALGSYGGADYYAAYMDPAEPGDVGRLLCLIVALGEDEGAAWTCDTDSDQSTLTFLNVGPGDHTLVGDAVDTDYLTESGWKKVGLNVWARPHS
jgi:hypothetical protein